MPAQNTPRIARLYITDRPDEYDGHQNVYHLHERPRHVIAVSFQAANGRAVRVSFDPETGDFTSLELER